MSEIDERARKFTYTEEDAAGCTMQEPDYSFCEGCLYEIYKGYQRGNCAKFLDGKPSEVIYDKKPCPEKKKSLIKVL